MGIDCIDIYAPVVRLETVRLMISWMLWKKGDIVQMDISNAFLQADIDTEVFMRQPPGYIVKGKEDWLWKLKKSIYGLRQALKLWNSTIHQFLIGEMGLVQCPSEPCVYFLVTESC